MSGLSLNVGLFSGIDYVSLVDQLIKLDGISKDNLAVKNQRLEMEYDSLTALMGRFFTASYMIRNLNRLQPYLRTDVTSSNPSLISVVRTGSPIVGSYTFTPLQMASSQQTVARGVASDKDALGKTGTITIGKGWSVENQNSIDLNDLNGGLGISKGLIRITDGNGGRATIDLRKATSIRDVVHTINENYDVDVIAELDGDRLVLRDVSGGDPSKMSVNEVSGGRTAASLGLIGTGVAVDSEGVLRGNSIWYLGENTSLSLLNDGNGLVFDSIWEDLSIRCKDGSSVRIDFNKLSTSAEIEAGAPQNRKELTVGDLLNTINRDGNGKITARISDDGKGITLEDTTSGNSLTTISHFSTNPAIMRLLGLSDRDHSPSESIDMFSDYRNGAPAKMTVTDANGLTADIALTGIDFSLIQAVGNTMTATADRINTRLTEAGLALQVQVNNSYNGFTIVDTSGGGGGTISFSNYNDPLNGAADSDLATRLGLTSMEGTDLLSSLQGVIVPETIRFTDKDGNWVDIIVTQADLDTVKASGDNSIALDELIDMFNDKLTDASALVAGSIFAVGTGDITFTDSDGDSVVINITQTELDALTSPDDIANLLNSKIGTSVGIVFAVNSNGSLVLNDTAGGTENVKVESDSATVPYSLAVFLGIEGTFETNQIIGRALRPIEFDSAAEVGIHVQLNAAGDGLRIVDTTGGSAAYFSVNRQGVAPGNVINSLTYRLGINQNSDSDEIQGRSFGSLYNAGTVQNGSFTTRNLIGGLDTVLVSTLNGGFGLHNAKPGAIEVQDRAGNSATLTFSAEELKSMQTLSDSVKLFNAKLEAAGVGITVRINEQKTGLEVVDTTGKNTHNLIFRDPTTVAVPAVPGVNAVSGDNGTGGTAALTFANTHWMNGFTFGFTTNLTDAGYDSPDQKFTFYLDETALLAETNLAARDAMVRAAINAQIASVWNNGVFPSSINPGEPPQVQFTSAFTATPGSFTDAALADAVSGGETAIKTTATGAVMGVTPQPAVYNDSKIASSFGLNVNSTSASVNGTSLNRQIISHNTLLSELNGGAGVNMVGARIVIRDSMGVTATLSIPDMCKTVGDFMELFNRQNPNVIAKISESGDGITFEDFASGTGTLSISDADSTSKFAESMGITVSKSEKDADGRIRFTKSETHRIEVEATDSLDDIRKKINDLNAGYSATILVDGSNTPYRLSLSSKQTGAAGAFNVDLSALGLTTETMSEAKDAKIVYGDASVSSGLVLSSSTNTFKGVINGADLTITGVSDTPVTITSASSAMDVLVSLRSFVENYNTFREQLNVDMYYEASTTAGIQANSILWNSPIAKAFDRDVTNMLQKTVTGIPGIHSLAALGITMSSNAYDATTGTYDPTVTKVTGKLYFDEDKFMEVWERDPEGVQKFFFDQRETTDASGKKVTVNTGWAQQFSDMADRLIGSNDGAVTGKVQARLDVLDQSIFRNEQRIEFMEERLEFKRQMYLKQFYAMEQALARMTTDMSAVSNIASAWSSNYSAGGGTY